jgi:membrane protease YdiL (CAAX protease family)
MNHSRTSLNQTVEHLYLGVLVTAAYVVLAPRFIDRGYPGLGALLFVELFVLAPIVIAHLLVIARQLNRSWSLDNVILYREKIGWKRFLLWYVIGLVAVNVTYIPLYPVGLFVRGELFTWLPEWYFNPGYGATDIGLVANMFLLGIIIDGIIGPTMEELFFRGYLLPRMGYLKGWAPVVNGALFGLYHFWQPHNLIALVIVGTILSYIVWKTKNVYLGIAVHCTMNVVGAVGGYLAVVNGVFMAR